MDHRNPDTYRFDEYLEARGDDWLEADPVLQKWLQRSAPSAEARGLVGRMARLAATEFDASAHRVELRQNLPYIADADAYNQRRRDVVLPAETWQNLGAVHGSGIWRADADERARYAIVFLLSQNGEYGVVCSTACTDGMLRALRRLGDDDRSREVVRQLEEATPDAWIHGAQFVTEIQGGSDAATNQLQAEPVEDGLYSLTGQKWFCSNLTADYWMMTARIPGGPDDHRGVSLLCVPRRWKGEPNGWRLDRLKDKLGTRALPTAEIQFEGARGWLVGPRDAGLKNMVAVVLTTSRVYNTIASAGAVRRATREARAYASFRRAFGARLADHPLVASSLGDLEKRSDRLTAGALGVVDVWLDSLAHPDDAQRKLWARILISIAKAVTAREAVPHVYEAMMVLGGNGIEEQFCSLPRLWRDAAIMETWEGPYTLLLMQALGDLAKFGVAGREEELLRYGLRDFARSELTRDLKKILAAPEDQAEVQRWGQLAPELFHAFAEQALASLG